jgi:hypothetical protein
MKSNELNPTDEQVMQTLRRQTRGLRWLTAVAIAFWTLAVLGTVGVLVFYSIFYAPKEKQMFRDYNTYGHLTHYTNSADPTAGSLPAGPATPEQALGVHFTMNYVATKAILVVAVSVIILSAGTLTTLLLVVLNRRVTLKQINHSLAQISEQLRQLQKTRDA